MSGLVLYLAKCHDQLQDAKVSAIVREQLVTQMTHLTSALPPAVDGDQDEALICIEQYCKILLTYVIINC